MFNVINENKDGCKEDDEKIVDSFKKKTNSFKVKYCQSKEVVKSILEQISAVI